MNLLLQIIYSLIIVESMPTLYVLFMNVCNSLSDMSKTFRTNINDNNLSFDSIKKKISESNIYEKCVNFIGTHNLSIAKKYIGVGIIIILSFVISIIISIFICLIMIMLLVLIIFCCLKFTNILTFLNDNNDLNNNCNNKKHNNSNNKKHNNNRTNNDLKNNNNHEDNFKNNNNHKDNFKNNNNHKDNFKNDDSNNDDFNINDNSNNDDFNINDDSKNDDSDNVFNSNNNDSNNDDVNNIVSCINDDINNNCDTSDGINIIKNSNYVLSKNKNLTIKLVTLISLLDNTECSNLSIILGIPDILTKCCDNNTTDVENFNTTKLKEYAECNKEIFNAEVPIDYLNTLFIHSKIKNKINNSTLKSIIQH